MRVTLVSLVMLLLIGCLPPQPPQPPTPPACYATLAYVVAGLGGVPLEGVNADRADTSEPDGTTNADGYIAWELPCATYTVVFTKPGYRDVTAITALEGNTQVGVSMIPVIPPLQRLHTDGIYFRREDGTRWNWYGLSAFSLAYDISQGREADVVRFLDWTAANNVTIIRVFTTAVNLFDLDPESGRRASERLLTLAENRGLYTELVGLADTAQRHFDHQDHLWRLGMLCASHPSCLIEIANEPNHPTQVATVHDPNYLATLAQQVPESVLVAYGAAHGPSDESLDYAGGDYVTVHIDRSEGEDGWRKVRHAREIQALRDAHHHKPAVSDEPWRTVPDTDKHLGLGLLARLYSFGDTVHLQSLIRGQIPTGDELNAFLAHRRAWNALPRDWTGRYSRATLGDDPITSLDPDDILRAYSSLRPNEGYVLGLRVLRESSIRWGNAWRADLHITEGQTRLWRATR